MAAVTGNASDGWMVTLTVGVAGWPGWASKVNNGMGC